MSWPLLPVYSHWEPDPTVNMEALLDEIRHNPLLWLLAFVPVVFVTAKLEPEAHTLLFVLSVLAVVPLATLSSTGPCICCRRGCKVFRIVH